MSLLSSGCLIILCCCSHETYFDFEDIFSCTVFLFQCQCVCAAVSAEHSVIVFVQQSVQNTVSLCLCSSQCRTQCYCVCAAVSAEHSVIVFVQQSVQNTVSLCLCSSQCRTQCHCVCAAVSAEHSVIVIAKCWSILYWSKNQLQTVCYENFLMLCLTGRHRETIRYYTAWCWSILLDILQHYVEVYCLIQYLHHSIVFQQIQTQEGNIRNKT